MLQKLRDSITGWMAYVVIGILAIPFALWGIGDYFGVFGENFAAKVGDTEISVTEYRNRFNQRYAQLRDAYGENFRPELIDETRLRQEVLDQIIEEELLYQYAYDRGFRISDERLLREIHAIEAFHDPAGFSAERYRFTLQAVGETPNSFERGLRRGLVIGQLQQSLSQSGFLPTERVDAVVRLADQRREMAWAEVASTAFQTQAVATDEQVAEYYAANGSRFMTEETVVVELVEITRAAAAGGVEIDEAGLRAYYEDLRRAATAGEERRASHILVADEAAATELKRRLDAGEDFAALAAEHSIDTDSAAAGGSIGWIARDSFMKEFEDALFALAAGEVSAPVRSGFGWHLIRADEIRAEAFASFEEMREELEAGFREREADRRFHDLLERLADLAFETPDSLQPAADATGVEVQRIEGVTRVSGTGPMEARALRAAAFAPEVLEEGFNSDLVELEDGRVAVVRVASREPPRQRELEEVSGRIRDLLVRNEARRLAAEAGEQIFARANAGEELVDVARELGAEWHSARSVGRSDAATPPEVLDAVFRAPRPEEGGQRVIRGLETTGGYAVFVLYDVEAGTPESLDPAQRDGLTQALSSRVSNAEFNALLESLKADTEIQYGKDPFGEGTLGL